MYNQYVLAAKVETMVIRNQLAVQDKESNGNIKANRMAPDVVLKNRKSTKFFTGLFPDQFEVLFNFLGPAVHNLKYCASDLLCYRYPVLSASGLPGKCTH